MSLNFGSLRRSGPSAPKLRTQRVNAGIYEYSYDGRIVEVQYQPRNAEDGVWPMWLTASTTWITIPSARPLPAQKKCLAIANSA